MEKERKEGLEVSVNMEFVDLGTHYRRQIGFIGNFWLYFVDFLVMPVWRELTNKFGEF